MNNLTQRIITAVIGAVLIISSILWNAYSFSAIFFLLAINTQYEYLKLIRPQPGKPVLYFVFNIAGGIISYWILAGIAFQLFDEIYLSCMLIVFSSLFIIGVFQKNIDPFVQTGLQITGIIYIIIPFALLNIVAIHGDVFKPLLVLGFVIAVWSYDTLAYFTGRTFGKHKLFERISPNKTWEGFIGGSAAAVICCFIFSKYSEELSVAEWIGVAVIIIIFGTIGDLVESKFKRSLQLKDSSHILPGHGGFLDRFDAMLMAIPFVFLYIILLSP